MIILDGQACTEVPLAAEPSYWALDNFFSCMYNCMSELVCVCVWVCMCEYVCMGMHCEYVCTCVYGYACVNSECGACA